MQLRVETYSLQASLARYCQTGIPTPIPGTHSPERVAVYRRLVFNNIQDQLRLAYPILHSFLPEEKWDALVKEFFAQHDCSAPQLWQMPLELVRFVEQSSYSKRLNLPFLQDLLEFEWNEIELFMTSDIVPPPLRATGSVLDDPLVLNPILNLKKYDYPVFRVQPADLANQAGDYFLLSFRHPETCSVQFLELAPLTVRVVEILHTAPTSGRLALSQAGEELGVTDFSLLYDQGEKFLQTLLHERAALGFALECATK